MKQEEFGKLIKDIRNKYHLTQKDLADKYHVTYQAVSKWENGKNLPDVSLIKEICQDYDISMDEMVLGNNSKKRKNVLYILGLVLLLLVVILIIALSNKDDSFSFKTLSASCDDFNISGAISYNDLKSSIYISNISYCGGDNHDKYKEIICTLYENSNDINKIISSYSSDNLTTLEDFLKNVNFTIDNYQKVCKKYSQDSLYLEISAKDINDKVTLYKIPLTLNDECNK